MILNSKHPFLPGNAFSRQSYEMGRSVVDAGIGPANLMWDADEILWDWLLCGRLLCASLYKFIRYKDLAHREWIQIRPGIVEFLFGMRHRALEQGVDPDMRIWTNGYPWRVHQIAAYAPFAELLGTPGATVEDFAEHPRVFYRPDYARALDTLLDPAGVASFIGALPAHIATVVRRHLTDAPFDSSFKLPEFARIVGKTGFEEVRYLVDDSAKNVRRFVESGRAGVRVRSVAPTIVRGKVPNSTWRDPRRALPALAGDYISPIAAALIKLAKAGHVGRVDVSPSAPVDAYPKTYFTLDVPDEKISGEWVRPLRQKKALYNERA